MNISDCTTVKNAYAWKYLLLIGVLFCASGATCSRSFRNPFTSPGPPAPEVLLGGASLDQVIAAVNQNSSRIQSYQTNDASISVPGMPAIPLLRGNIAAQRPGRLRLQASTALTGPEVDLGSNEELFWFWSKRNEPPALYFARHDQFVGSAAQQLMPIEPQWLLDAIGLAQFSTNDQHQGPVPRGDGTLEIKTIMQTRSGTMNKCTVVDASRAWVLEQHIYNSQGMLLASSRARSHRYYPEVGVSLPQEIDINLPAAQLSLSIDVGTVFINQLADNPVLWSIPALSGYPQVDLGTAPAGTLPETNTNSTTTRLSSPHVSIGGSVHSQQTEYVNRLESTVVPVFHPASSYSSAADHDNPLYEDRSTHSVLDPSAQKSIVHQLPQGGIPVNNFYQR